MIRELTRHAAAILFIAAAFVPASAQKPAGTAKVSLTGEGVAVSGDYPATRCGGPYMLGQGMAYQVKAGDWQITVASEQRASGNVPLNAADGGVNVVATANGPDKKSFARYPKGTGSLVVASDFRKAEATLELRNPVGKNTAKLVIGFVCG